jgi:Fe-S cluster biosynthesis and repair protein YggX
MFSFPSKAVLESRGRDPGMAQVQCVRCSNQGEAITEPLFLGKLETQVKANICAPCWAEWVKMRVMVINEYHVNLGDESGRALVREQMLNFLKLPKPEQQPQ